MCRPRSAGGVGLGVVVSGGEGLDCPERPQGVGEDHRTESPQMPAWARGVGVALGEQDGGPTGGGDCLQAGEDSADHRRRATWPGQAIERIEDHQLGVGMFEEMPGEQAEVLIGAEVPHEAVFGWGVFLHQAQHLDAAGVGPQPVEPVFEHMGVRLLPNDQQHRRGAGSGGVGGCIGPGAAGGEAGGEVAGEERFARANVPGEECQFATADASRPEPVGIGPGLEEGDLGERSEMIEMPDVGMGLAVDGDVSEAGEPGRVVEARKVVEGVPVFVVAGGATRFFRWGGLKSQVGEGQVGGSKEGGNAIPPRQLTRTKPGRLPTRRSREGLRQLIGGSDGQLRTHGVIV